MKYNFDEVIDRRNTSCLKYDFAVERGLPGNVLPLWVADMDFRTAQPILDRLNTAVEHGIFGYTESGDDYFAAVAGWYKDHFDWKVERRWLIKTPGVVFALAAAVRAFTKEGDSVLIQQPVYYPFSEVINDNNRKLINNPLINRNGHYEINFEDFENKIVENDVHLFIMCSPHNPVGRVWTKDELQKTGDICLKHNVIIAIDEIHSDFTFPGHTHHVFADLRKEFAEISVTCTAPSKTFNLAGLQCSNIFIPNTKLRGAFRGAVNAAGYSQLNAFGLFACRAAYEEGGEWLAQLKEYLVGNLDFLRNFINDRLPGIHLVEPEGTYLIWLDCRDLGLTPEELDRRIIYEAGLWLDSGRIFGADGNGYQRINIACPRVTLGNALEKLTKIIY